MTGPSLSPSAKLRGRRILVAEDEYMIAREVAEVLSDAGAETLGPVPSVADALALIAAGEGCIDAALLDASLQGNKVWPLVDALLERSVPVVLTTGYDIHAIPQAYAVLPRCEKPVSSRDLTYALGKALDSAARM